MLSIQVNDGPLRKPEGHYRLEAMGGRLLCGEGEFPLVETLGALRDLGVTEPLTVEVVSLQLDELGPLAAARRMAQTTRDILARIDARTEVAH